MKLIHKLSVRIAIALVIGVLFAGAGTKITYTCALVDGAQGCTSFEKAIMHPNDLLDNKQNSLVKFSTTFALTSLIAFAILEAASRAQKRK